MHSDAELLERWRGGDPTAGEALIDRHYPAIRRFFANKVSTAPEAEDCTHETFKACLEGRDRVRDGASFRAFLFGIAHNVLRRFIGGKYRREREVADLAAVCVCEFSPSMTSIVTRRREELLLVTALRELPLEQQIALELYILEELSGPEIAELLDVPEGTVRGRLRLGQQRLRRRIEELAKDAEERASTLTDLEGWARRIRRAIDGVPDA